MSSISGSASRTVKDYLKREYFRLYKLGSRLGFTIVPRHYYSAEPDILELERFRDVWSHPLSLHGIHVDLDEQVQELRTICEPFRVEYAGNHFYREAVAEGYGPGYGYIEAQALHGVIRHFRPARILEVGSGVSTRCAVEAANMNAREGEASCNITCIEPYPSTALREMAARSTHVELIGQQVQQTPLELFNRLGENDILFVDSSHVLKAGSDVAHIILEILPVLRPGVLVHFHDIYLPYAYQRDVLQTFLHNNETPVLASFLAYNDRFRIVFCLSHLHYERPETLVQTFPEYEPQASWRGLRTENASGHFPSALWLQVMK